MKQRMALLRGPLYVLQFIMNKSKLITQSSKLYRRIVKPLTRYPGRLSKHASGLYKIYDTGHSTDHRHFALWHSDWVIR